MAGKRVVHYINQFYAGMGGEDTAGVGLSTQAGPAGPGLMLKDELGDEYEIVRTIICGDNTIAENPDEIIPQILQIVREENADLFIAGPGFNAGRYGLGCGAAAAELAAFGLTPAGSSNSPRQAPRLRSSQPERSLSGMPSVRPLPPCRSEDVFLTCAYSKA